MASDKGLINRDQQIKEILKCGKDPVYFMRNYAKIQHPVRGLIPFETYPFQDDCVRSFEKNRFNIILKSRQLGLSTVTAAYAVWYAIFKKDKNILVIATKLPTAMNFIKKVKTILDGLPKWLVLTKYEPTKQSIPFANGSCITAIPTSPDAGRSEALSLLIVDEAAFIRDFEDIWTGLYPTISCVVGDTRVLTKDGFKRIDHMCVGKSPGDYFTLNENIYAKNGFEQTSHGYVSPSSPTYKITTKTGRIIESTLEHPIWTLRDAKVGMIKTKNLKVGDAFRVQYGTEIYGSDPTLDLDEAYRLGGYIAEGWIPRQAKNDNAKRYSIYISNSDPEFRQKFLDVGFRATHGIKMLKCSREEVVKYESYGIDPKQKCDTKRIPEIIFRSPKHIQQSFLRGYFDGDGYGSNGISASTASEGLAQDLQLLLLNMNIRARIKKVVSNPTKAGVGVRRMPSGQILSSVKDCWKLSIPRSELKKFSDNIGFLITRKQQSIQKEIALRNNCDFSTRLNELPNSTATIIQNCIISKIKNHPTMTFGSLRRTKDLRIEKLPTQSRVRDFIRNCPEVCEDSWNEIIGSETDQFYWDEIISIENSVAQTYDFTVPGSHTFLQNLILGSNTGGSAIIISTPNGVGGTYYKLWTDATSQQNDFNTINLPWWVHPEHDQAWFDKESKGFSKKRISQEFLCDFISSGDTFLQPTEMDYLREMIDAPIRKEGPAHGVWIWVDPKPDQRYVISADVSRGDSADFSTFHIINVDTCEVVAEYMGKIPPDKLADLLAEYGKKYNTALLCPERNTFGYFTCVKLRDMPYKRLYYRNTSGDPFEYISNDPEAVPGFETQGNTRPQILAKLEEVIRNKVVKIYSQRFYDQMQSFVWSGSKAQASKDSHDDLILCLAIGTWLTHGGTTSGDQNVDIAMAMLKATSVQRRDPTQMPGNIESAQPLVNPNVRGVNPYNSNHLRNNQNGRQSDISDFRWLLR